MVGSFSDDFGPSNPNMGIRPIGSWVFVQKLSNSDQDDYDRFGWSVAIDGDLIVVGAYREDHNVNAELFQRWFCLYLERDGGGGINTNDADELRKMNLVIRLQFMMMDCCRRSS